MGPSDILTVLTIILAIAAFISERSRTYVLLKFNSFHWVLLIVGFLYVHFLVSFDWFSERFPWLKKFVLPGYPTPAAWAYILSLILLFWIFYKVFVGFYPGSRREAVIDNYRNLLLRGDYAFLSELIEKYHFKDIVEYIKREKSIGKIESTGNYEDDEELEQDATKKVLSTNRLNYAARVYYQIFLNDAFIDVVVPVNPVLFAPVISQLNDSEVKQPEFVNRFLRILTRTQNGVFFRELRNNTNLENNNNYRIEEERPILYSLFKDVNVTAINEAWRGVAEEAILEMNEESKKQSSQLRFSDVIRDKDSFWNYRMRNAIQYFDIMVREAINSGISNHMWMYYYEHFVDAIIKNMEPLPDPDSDQNRHSGNFKMIETIFMNMMDWKDVALRSKKPNLVTCIYDVMGRCIYSISTTEKLTDEDKRYLMNWVWEDIVDSTNANDNEQQLIVDNILEQGFKLFLRPSGLFNPPYNRYNGKAYLRALKIMWDKRDLPKLYGAAGERADKFKKEVIKKLL
jgi:hypothetical protein